MEKCVIPKGEALGEAFEVYQAQGAFDKCVDEFKAKGLEVITAKQLAEARMRGGANHAVSRSWTWLAENFNYLPNGDILVASKAFNPLLQYASFAKMATDCHRQIPFMEFCLNDDVVGYLLEGAKQKGGVLQLRRKDIQKEVTKGISTDDFGKMELTAFLFGDKAEDYGKFLRKNEIKSVPLYVANKQSKAFSRALWAFNLYYSSALHGSSFLLNNLGRAFGVRTPQGASEQPEAASQGVRSTPQRAVSGLEANVADALK